MLLFPSVSAADVVKPALIELTLYPNGTYQLEVRASIEAMLTGINARYKNTQDAPNAEEYDHFRAMEPPQLDQAFKGFEEDFLEAITLEFDGEKSDPAVESVDIPLPGYKKVPRISTIILTGEIPKGATKFGWTYPERFGDDAFRYRHFVKDEYTWGEWTWLRNGESIGPLELKRDYSHRPWWRTAWSYLSIGFLHIVPKGTDHILFILGMFLMTRKLGALMWQATAFTVAHTITLGLSMYGLIDVPPRVLEPLIALSIAYIGLENVFLSHLKTRRVVLVFLFGLLHGLGFARALANFGMPREDFALALASFNIGVELGQVNLILLAWLLIGVPFGHLKEYRRWVVIPGSLLIGLLGLTWMIDRIVNA